MLSLTRCVPLLPRIQQSLLIHITSFYISLVICNSVARSNTWNWSEVNGRIYCLCMYFSVCRETVDNPYVCESPNSRTGVNWEENISIISCMIFVSVSLSSFSRFTRNFNPTSSLWLERYVYIFNHAFMFTFSFNAYLEIVFYLFIPLCGCLFEKVLLEKKSMSKIKILGHSLFRTLKLNSEYLFGIPLCQFKLLVSI